jgi:hypothetical protein
MAHIDTLEMSAEEREKVTVRRRALREEMKRKEVLSGLGDELSKEFTQQYNEWAAEEAKLVAEIQFHEAQLKESNRYLRHRLLTLQKESHKLLLRRVMWSWWKHVRQHTQGKQCDRVMLIYGEPRRVGMRRMTWAFQAFRVHTYMSRVKTNIRRALRINPKDNEYNDEMAVSRARLIPKLHGIGLTALRWAFVGWWLYDKKTKDTKTSTGGSQFWSVGPNEKALRPLIARGWLKYARLLMCRKRIARGRSRVYNKTTSLFTFYRWKTLWYQNVKRVKDVGMLLALHEGNTACMCALREWSNYTYERKVERKTSENAVIFKRLAATELKAWEGRIESLRVALEEAMASESRRQNFLEPKTHAEDAERAAARHRRESPQSPLFFRRQYDARDLADDTFLR